MHYRFLTIDFETRSPVILKHASYRRYAMHPGTGILCLGLQFDGRPASVQIPPAGSPIFVRGHNECPIEIKYAIANNIPIYAHNNPFDRSIYQCICVDRLGWPEIPEHLWRDTIAVASYYHLPRRLEYLAQSLNCEVQKDTKGGKTLKQVMKPRKPRKKEIEAWVKEGRHPDTMPTVWYEDGERLHRVYEYCRIDLETQTECLLKMGPLPPDRLADWQFDQKVNARGIAIDFVGLIYADQVIDKAFDHYNRAITEATRTFAYPEGMATKVTQRDRIIDWCGLYGVEIDSLAKEPLEKLLQTELPPIVKYVLTLRQDAGKSSLGKIETMLNQCDWDGRVRDTLVYHKASTGRWAGRGIQPHNFPNQCLDEKETEEFHHLLLTHGDLGSHFQMPVPDLMARALRSFIIASPGNHLLISDFNAIEARVSAWLCGCVALLNDFFAGRCPYRAFAEKATGKPYAQIGKSDFERRLGKVSVLALSYGMGGKRRGDTPSKFQTTAAGPLYKVELSDYQSEQIVGLYRKTYWEIPAMWQKLERALIEAIEYQKPFVPVGRWISVGSTAEWAWIRLPSGRCIWYGHPRIERTLKFDKMVKSITFMGVSKTGKWCREATWGGTLLENVTQATAADIMLEAMKRTDAAGFPAILSVHDEVIADAPKSKSKDEFHQLMRVVPSWAPGLPIECETHASQRYGK